MLRTEAGEHQHAAGEPRSASRFEIAHRVPYNPRSLKIDSQRLGRPQQHTRPWFSGGMVGMRVDPHSIRMVGAGKDSIEVRPPFPQPFHKNLLNFLERVPSVISSADACLVCDEDHKHTALVGAGNGLGGLRNKARRPQLGASTWSSLQ